MKILGIETSCDETSVAIVSDDRTIHAHKILSQISTHAPYGGVVPELASRAHIDHLDHLITQALDEANLSSVHDIDGIAVTAGPGLIGGVIVGVMTAKAIASVTKKPIVAVNHLEGHALTIRLIENTPFPYLLLLVSGGHCQICVVNDLGNYTILGQTIDDALGEAFDKVAKMLGLEYPGGPKVEQLAKNGDPTAYNFPRSLTDRPGCDFSFSGLKTAVKRQVDAIDNPTEQDKANICTSFQACVGDIIENRLKNALKQTDGVDTLVVAGGVAANQALNERIQTLCQQNNLTFKAPPMKLCTDNAAMIAWCGIEYLQQGISHDLSFAPKARWPLRSK